MSLYHQVCQQAVYYPVTLAVGRPPVSRDTGWAGNFDLGQPLNYAPTSRRMRIVLQKAGEG
jgi:hypothetical protein